MTLQVDLSIPDDVSGAPEKGQFLRWASAAVGDSDEAVELSIRIVHEDESRSLNMKYRNKDRATNVLAFPAELPEGVSPRVLGDLAICSEVVESEARSQGKTIESHWAHMVVHGTLHLLGHDHLADDEARQMEAMEVQILQGLGYADPYAPQGEEGDLSPASDARVS